MTHVLCSISTRGRYHTTLPLAISSVINQTRLPNQLIIFDDNDEPEDMRNNSVYQNLFKIMNIKGIQWEWIWTERRGQHHNHQMANTRAQQWVWRVDDDCIAESNVLANLVAKAETSDHVGAVGGSILTPSWDISERQATGTIAMIDQEPSIQWGKISVSSRVEHLHCSFLYRAGLHDYNLALSRVAHREETLFSWGLHQKGYELWVLPNTVTWHLKSDHGGIRTYNQKDMFDRDNSIFQNFLSYKNHTIVVLDCGMGDHVVFSHVLPKIRNPVVFSCYPDLVPGASIQEAIDLFGDLSQWSIYKKMDQWQWTSSLQHAFEKLYGVSR